VKPLDTTTDLRLHNTTEQRQHLAAGVDYALDISALDRVSANLFILSIARPLKKFCHGVDSPAQQGEHE
jgi:hypothetical protein